MVERKAESNFVESILKAIGNTKSTTELMFEKVEIGVSSIDAKITLSGKITLVVRPLHE